MTYLTPERIAYIKRNKLVLSQLGLFCLGLLIAIFGSLGKCDPKPADVVALLDGSGSLSDSAFNIEVASSKRFLGTLSSSLGPDAKLQQGVVQWGGEAPVVVSQLTNDLESVAQNLNPGAIIRFPVNTPARGTRFSTALAACGTQLLTNSQVDSLGVCVMISDGENQEDDGETYTNDNFGVSTYCQNAGIPLNQCSANGIASFLKSQSVLIVGVFVEGQGNDANIEAGKRQLRSVTSCEGSTECSNFIAVQSIEDLDERAQLLAEYLADIVGICVSSPGLFVLPFLLVLPMLIYLLWRPITICLAKKAIEKSFEVEPEAPPLPPKPTKRGVPPLEKIKSKRPHWKIKAADHYLWNFAGGAAPMLVDFAGAAPPSAPKKRATKENLVRIPTERAPKNLEEGAHASILEEPEAILHEDEPRAGDLDYEFVRLLLRCCGSCFMPNIDQQQQKQSNSAPPPPPKPKRLTDEKVELVIV